MKQLMNPTAIEKECLARVDRDEAWAAEHGKKINRDRRLAKYVNEILAKWKRIEAMPDPESIVINIEWKKSRMWGYNPHAKARVHCKDGTFRTFETTCGGCGYDKHSTVVAHLLNECLLGVLTRAYAKGVMIPYGATGCRDGIYPPRFDDGVGMSCYDGDHGVLTAIGCSIMHTASGDSFDSWCITYPAPKKRRAKGA
ncbi:MAG: hypothetical protein WC107_07450 [Patescibacteria group bacterium]